MAPNFCPGPFGTAAVIFTLLLCSIIIASPVSAATRYLGDGPAFTATVIGTNEFVPGTDTTIRILVRNTGLHSMKQLGVGTIEPEDQQNTAKATTIGLGSGGDAVIVRTDPQMVGDIRGGGSVTIEFSAKISGNATEGEYILPLTLEYQYPKVMNQEQADVFEFAYNDGETTLPVTIRIQSRVNPVVVEAVPEQIISGSEGYLNLTIRNTGPENGTKASVTLIRNGKSPIIPTSSTVFIGDFPSGGTVTCRYKVSVSKDSTNQSYPVDLAVTYTNREGMIVTSSLTTIGVSVNAKPGFSIVSAAHELSRGAESAIDVAYRNDGDITVYAAMARITPHDPFTSSDSNAYLGDIAPGASATARFPIHADQEADLKVYSLDSTVRYRDAAGTSLESDTIPIPVQVVPASGGLSAVPGGMITIGGCVILVVVLCIAFIAHRKKTKSQ